MPYSLSKSPNSVPTKKKGKDLPDEASLFYHWNMGKPPKDRKTSGRVTEKGTRPTSPPSSKRKKIAEGTSTNTIAGKKPRYKSSKKQDNHHPEKSWKNRPL
jgi:hypothetical protein